MHWDAQGQHAHGDVSISYDSEVNSESTTTVVSASVMLTNQAAWDDSDLIDAWDAAMEEYRVGLLLVACVLLLMAEPPVDHERPGSGLEERACS